MFETINKFEHLTGSQIVSLTYSKDSPWSKVYSKNTKAVIIDKIISDIPQKIYLDYGESLGISKNEYFKYFKNVDIAYAIKIKKVIRYEKELTLADFNLERAPQSYQYIE